MRVIACHCRVVSVGIGVSNKHPLGKRVSNKHPLETCRVLFEQPLRVSFRVDFDKFVQKLGRYCVQHEMT